ncbi:MAG: sialate O-acetylesterase [Phycisphaerales bacterium]|jgi:hypothetical protein|nr:sialate O-acetylesterase [Phycisphaerales bacterium]
MGALWAMMMRRLMLFASVVTAAAQADSIDLVLLAGDGNVGRIGQTFATPPQHTESIVPQPTVLLRSAVDGVDDVTEWVQAAPQGVEFGIEMSLAHTLAAFHPDRTFGIMRYAVSDASMACDWQPGDCGSAVLQSMLDRVDVWAGELVASGHEVRLAGVVFVHGQTDSIDQAAADAYAGNLGLLSAAIRDAFGNPDLPFVFGIPPMSGDWTTTVGRGVDDHARGDDKVASVNLTTGRSEDGLFRETGLVAAGIALGDALLGRDPLDQAVYSANCPQDLLPNGVVDVADLLYLMSSWGPCGRCRYDFNMDGLINVDDLLVVIGAWGTPDADVTGDGFTDVNDMLAVIGAWGPCER